MPNRNDAFQGKPRVPDSSPETRPFGSPRYIPLKYRFIVWSCIVLVLLLGTLAGLLGVQQSRTFRTQLEKRGLAMAESLGALSRGALVTYNYVLLEQAANQAGQNPEVLYVILHDKEGRVAGYSGRPDLQGRELEDLVTERALAARTTLVHESLPGPDGKPGMEVAFPVTITGSELRWGLIRVGLSLEPMYTQLGQMRTTIASIGLLALLVGVAGATLTARRITKPLARLVEATVEAAHGNLEPEIRVDTGDEVGVLARNFRIMIQEILRQRQRLEKQLVEIRRLQDYNERLLTTMSDGLLAVERDGRVATINPAACRLLGLTDEDHRGKAVECLLEGNPELVEYLRSAVETRAVQPQRELRARRSSDDRVVLASSSLLLDQAGNLVEVITNLHDVTEMKKLEARIRQTDRLAALGTLAAGMAHEIRNPLSAIKTFVQLLPRKLEKPGFLDKFNRTVPRELDRINRLIEDLLELARTPRYRLQELALGPLLEQNLDVLDEEIRMSNVILKRTIPHNLPRIWADPDLAKAFHNLVRNALQAMPSGGILCVEAHAVAEPVDSGGASRGGEGWCAVRFSDTGSGIDPQVLPNIFNPFFSTKDSGTGLGLAITHKVISEHGGKIDVVSEPGRGSAFTVYLPRMSSSEGQATLGVLVADGRASST